MTSSLASLTTPELLALALDANREGDAGRTMVYLKEAVARPDASPEACFLLGSEYAQIGLMDEALVHFNRALDIAPGYAIARFQLGLLHLTSARPEDALRVWAPLAGLGPEHPLAAFRQGLEHLIRDEFAAAIQWLERGIALNHEIPALNNDMAQMIERVRPLAAAAAEKAGDAEAEASHLFLNAYTRGQVH